ncbi:MAG: bpX6 domain-containing protein, partial [Massilia sp.]
MSNNIRRPIFSGVLAIDAIWFDAALIGEAEARRRVLARWQLGARLHAAGGGYVLTLASPVHQDCATLDGLALCRTGAILASAPLEADERSRVAYGGCAIVRGAQLHFYALAESEQVDAAAWVDVSAIAIRVPLAFPTSSPRSKLGAPEQHKPLRAILEDKIGLPSPEREAFLQGLSSGKGPSTGGGLAGALGTGAMAGAGLLAMLLQKLLKGLEGGGGRGAGDGAGSGTGAGTGGAGTSGTAPPAPLPAWKMRLYALAASLSNASGLAKVMGWQQANYLRNMIDMFERGDVAEALRHAIPIDGMPGSERQVLGNLQARSTLDITPQGGTVSTIGLDGETQNYLRQSYRKLF